MSNTKQLTARQLHELYQKTSHGVSVQDAANSLGIVYGTATIALRRLKKYMLYIADGSYKKRKRMYKTYLTAARWAVEDDNYKVVSKKEEIVETNKQKQVEEIEKKAATQQKNYKSAKLGLLLSIFGDAIDNIIEEEVESMCAPLRAENTKLKELVNSAQLNNWGNALKQRFEGTDDDKRGKTQVD